MKLEKIQKELRAAGIPAEIKNFSLTDETVEELWDEIRIENKNLEKWEQKQDVVMVAIISERIARLSQRIMERKEGKVFRISMVTINQEGQERKWKFHSIASVLKMWWGEEALDLPSGDDSVINLRIDGKKQKAGYCFEEAVNAFEEEYWKNNEGYFYL